MIVRALEPVLHIFRGFDEYGGSIAQLGRISHSSLSIFRCWATSNLDLYDFACVFFLRLSSVAATASHARFIVRGLSSIRHIVSGTATPCIAALYGHFLYLTSGPASAQSLRLRWYSTSSETGVLGSWMRLQGSFCLLFKFKKTEMWAWQQVDGYKSPSVGNHGMFLLLLFAFWSNFDVGVEIH
jgi:hypothetical protein